MHILQDCKKVIKEGAMSDEEEFGVDPWVIYVMVPNGTTALLHSRYGSFNAALAAHRDIQEAATATKLPVYDFLMYYEKGAEPEKYLSDEELSWESNQARIVPWQDPIERQERNLADESYRRDLLGYNDCPY
jgi:hypothetical protein